MSVELSMKYFTCSDCGMTWGVPELLKAYLGCPGCMRRELAAVKTRLWEAQGRADIAEAKLRRRRGR